MHRAMRVVGLGIALLSGVACRDAPAGTLAIVAARNAVGTIDQLLDQGFQPDQRGADGLTPLMWAARNGAAGAMTELLDRGADPDARDRRNGWTPLFHAIHKQHVEAVRVLLEYGADPNARINAFTPLMMAASDRDPTSVQLLLSYGADPGARGYGGATALSYAVSGGALSDIDRPLLGGCRTETVRALKSHDPRVDVPDTIAGWNALWWAKFHGCREVLNMVGPSGMRTKG